MADFARSAHPGVQAQLDRLSKLSPAGDRLGLERIATVLDRLGRPQDALPPVFHVAGTNGKGSTVAFLRAALEASGHSVHAFTSPHLVRFNERIRVAGRLIEDEDLSRAAHRSARMPEGTLSRASLKSRRLQPFSPLLVLRRMRASLRSALVAGSMRPT